MLLVRRIWQYWFELFRFLEYRRLGHEVYTLVRHALPAALAGRPGQADRIGVVLRTQREAAEMLLLLVVAGLHDCWQN